MKLEAWVCPVHGIVDEDDLVEGRDPNAATPDDPDGWTGRYYCFKLGPCAASLQEAEEFGSKPDACTPCRSEVRFVELEEKNPTKGAADV